MSLSHKKDKGTAPIEPNTTPRAWRVTTRTHVTRFLTTLLYLDLPLLATWRPALACSQKSRPETAASASAIRDPPWGAFPGIRLPCSFPRCSDARACRKSRVDLRGGYRFRFYPRSRHSRLALARTHKTTALGIEHTPRNHCGVIGAGVGWSSGGVCPCEWKSSVDSLSVPPLKPIRWLGQIA